MYFLWESKNFTILELRSIGLCHRETINVELTCISHSLDRLYSDVHCMYSVLYGIWKGGIQMFTLCFNCSMGYGKVIFRC